MKRSHAVMMAIAILALAPVNAFAQGGGAGGGMGGGGMGGGRGGMGGGMMMSRTIAQQGSVEFLLSKATDLQLTADQTAKLKDIATQFAAATKEAREHVTANAPQAGQGMGGGDREAMMARMQALRPHTEKLTAEDAKAVELAMAVLADAQKEKAKSLLDERRQSAMPRRGGGTGGGR